MVVNKVLLSNGAEGLFIKNSRFNTTLVSFNFYLPIDRARVADFALLPFVLTTCSKRYPDFRKLNYKLSKLYGAELTASCEKVGDFQLLKMSISVINDKYTLDNEELTSQAIELLTNLVFEPKTENGGFFASDIEREKRKAIEHIKGEFAEKRIYSKERLISEMYKGLPYGVPKCGRIEDVENITEKSLFGAWEDMLKHSFIRVNVVSDSMPQNLFDTLSERFSSMNRDNITDFSNITPTTHADKVNKIVELESLNQGKLVMGFSCDSYGGDKATADLFVACDIFGGGPYSKLFGNVREKMSLCYYCTARAVRNKGLITVESGIEKENAEKAEKAILEQLSNLQNGILTDSEFESSIMGLTDSLKSYNDSQDALELWYSTRLFDDEIMSPDEFAESLKNVTKETAVKASKGIKLHTVFALLPKEDK